MVVSTQAYGARTNEDAERLNLVPTRSVRNRKVWGSVGLLVGNLLPACAYGTMHGYD